ncbi:MAG: TraR/DksA family transcriptional regulator [Actinoallomurus sp.]
MVVDTAQRRLEDMLAELDRAMAVLRSEHPEADQHTADAGASLSATDRAEAALDAMSQERAEVLAALARARAGTYGKCVDCGQPVPASRLEARPAAARCVACQAKRDQFRR